jgi:hypothetical protein
MAEEVVAGIALEELVLPGKELELGKVGLEEVNVEELRLLEVSELKLDAELEAGPGLELYPKLALVGVADNMLVDVDEDADLTRELVDVADDALVNVGEDVDDVRDDDETRDDARVRDDDETARDLDVDSDGTGLHFPNPA